MQRMGRTCSKCGGTFDLSRFGVSRQRPDGLKTWCKQCCTAHLRDWANANPEKVAERRRRYYENNRDAILEKTRIARAKNPELAQAVVDAWHAKHPDARRIARREWAARNRVYGAISRAKRRALEMQATPKWASSEFDDLVIREAYTLAAARTKATGVKHSVDHIVPLQSDAVCGLHCAANLSVIPFFENQSKSNRHWPGMP